LKKRVFVIGAGPSGLVAARELARSGHEVNVYETLDRVGGMCRSFNWRGYVLDIGPHIFHTSDEKLSNYWKEEFGNFLVEGQYWSQNVQGDYFQDYYDYPLSWESIAQFPNNKKDIIVKEIKSLKPSLKASAKTYKEYIDALAGPTLRKMFFERYPEKIWGISVDEMTADWAPKRINIYKKKTPFFDKQWTAIGNHGSGKIYEIIAKDIKKFGSNIFLESTLEKIETEKGSIKSLSVNGEKIEVSMEDIVISSIPVSNLLQLIGKKTYLKFRGVIVFYVDCNKKEIISGKPHWLYFDSPNVFFTRITEPKKMGLLVPDQDKTVITVEVPYSKNDALDRMDTAKLSSLLIDQLVLTGLIEKEDILDHKIIKQQNVYPVQSKGYQRELTRINGILNSFSQLYSHGAGAEFNYTDTQVLFKKSFDLVRSLDSDSNLKNIKLSSFEFNENIDFKTIKIGSSYPVFVIAEAGMNHNGDLELGKKLIDQAKETGCHAIKFQTFLPESRVSSVSKAVDFHEEADGIENSMFEMFNKFCMPFSEQKKLFNYAKSKEIEIFSTPFDIPSVDFLEEMDVCIYKIASMDLGNLPLIEYVAQTGKPIILSTGMSKLGDIEEALDTIKKTGNKNVALLHCNSTYPAPLEDMNLRAINTLRKSFQLPTGLSDHTFGLTVSQIALSIGANIIERHFTLDSTMEGPDHILSSEPNEIKELVSLADLIPKILGNGIKNIKPTEYETFNFQRKSLYAARKINSGELITNDMISIKGPFGEILPKDINRVINRVAKVDIDFDMPITWNSI